MTGIGDGGGLGARAPQISGKNIFLANLTKNLGIVRQISAHVLPDFGKKYFLGKSHEKFGHFRANIM